MPKRADTAAGIDVGVPVDEDAVPMPEADLEFSTCLTFLVRQAWLNLRNAVARELAQYDLSISEYAALLTLANRSGISAADLGQVISMTRQSAQELCNGLEARELVSRRVNPRDRRLYETELTDAGWQLLRAATAAVRATEQSFEAPLTRSQRNGARAWLDVIGDAANCTLRGGQ
ncbi:DNA-binding transcriptional regulator, MarR family [Jatrophihabitans endophyticus]|uniref:DNA-binding transcriptional regulator, MarR family n=1 Tax=Jatrophihabitans endophyticus TaxID=1206085 RepID=A0A1M5RG63_9ACTN|nr:MarR family transcriptional regulator [Jatrophihabitans endophyticus]SHH24753.1 DNA-binding transcriptional regulator, MarR family [Jatrophihabitans endophyticus]